MSSMKKTEKKSFLPLHNYHVKAGGKMGDFGGWEVPLYYTTILEEHAQVRSSAGVFDISHMGEFFVSGKDAAKFLDQILPRKIQEMPEGKALYMPLLNDSGGILDDIIVYCFHREKYLLIVNASNVNKDFAWLESCKEKLPKNFEVRLENKTADFGLLAVQGPRSGEVLKKAFRDLELTLKYYTFLQSGDCFIARTGYTGEDGYEIMVPAQKLPELWERLFHAGEGILKPVGFGARDTLRLEAGMLLYGHDMTEERTPLEAGIGWAIDWDKQGFTGSKVLSEQKQNGAASRLIGFEMLERGIPRQGFEILKNGQTVGEVTSGSFSPTLKKNIGLGYISASLAVPGTELEIKIRETAVRAKVVTLPFYKRVK